jgi:NAD(P)-dependent dehydrogenase (short-subunit alcohol dehydrogenase family)
MPRETALRSAHPNHFGDCMNTVLIIGASRGIGLELARQYCAAGDKVIATARKPSDLDNLRALGCITTALDVTDVQQLSGLSWQLDGEDIDIAIINAGVYGPRTAALEPITATDFAAVMQVNVLSSMQIIPQIAPMLQQTKGKLAVISSKMGSISLRAAAGGSLYRASKAALNSVLKDASVALPEVTCAAFHPGWVRTDMGGPGADISAEQSASGIRSVLASLTLADSGCFVNYDGERLAW